MEQHDDILIVCRHCYVLDREKYRFDIMIYEKQAENHVREAAPFTVIGEKGTGMILSLPIQEVQYSPIKELR